MLPTMVRPNTGSLEDDRVFSELYYSLVNDSGSFKGHLDVVMAAGETALANVNYSPTVTLTYVVGMSTLDRFIVYARGQGYLVGLSRKVGFSIY